jgi:hypothetical protein
MQQLAQVLIATLDSKKLNYAKVVKPLTKILLLTYRDGRDDLKMRSLKMLNFLMNVKGKVIERFKL